jgi:hypothetical protein
VLEVWSGVHKPVIQETRVEEEEVPGQSTGLAGGGCIPKLRLPIHNRNMKI